MSEGDPPWKEDLFPSKTPTKQDHAPWVASQLQEEVIGALSQLSFIFL